MPTDSDSGSSVLLLGALPVATAATPALPSSTAPVLVGGAEGVLVLFAASRRGLEPLSMMHAALCVITRLVTAPVTRLVLLSAMRNADAPRHAPHAGLLGLARCVLQEVPLLRLSLLHAADPRTALRALSAWAGVAEPEVALCVAPVRARVPRLAPLPSARHGRLQLRLPSRGAIANLKLEAQPEFGAPLGDSEIELEVRTRARSHYTLQNTTMQGHHLSSPSPLLVNPSFTHTGACGRPQLPRRNQRAGRVPRRPRPARGRLRRCRPAGWSRLRPPSHRHGCTWVQRRLPRERRAWPLSIART